MPPDKKLLSADSAVHCLNSTGESEFGLGEIDKNAIQHKVSVSPVNVRLWVLEATEFPVTETATLFFVGADASKQSVQ